MVRTYRSLGGNNLTKTAAMALLNHNETKMSTHDIYIFFMNVATRFCSKIWLIMPDYRTILLIIFVCMSIYPFPCLSTYLNTVSFTLRYIHLSQMMDCISKGHALRWIIHLETKAPPISKFHYPLPTYQKTLTNMFHHNLHTVWGFWL